MFGSIYKILSIKLNNRCIASILSRGMSKKCSTMEEYFKDKRFIVTGATAGKYIFNSFYKTVINLYV